jgi:hypothetical protein
LEAVLGEEILVVASASSSNLRVEVSTGRMVEAVNSATKTKKRKTVSP